jgi:hypothetical protein
MTTWLFTHYHYLVIFGIILGVWGTFCVAYGVHDFIRRNLTRAIIGAFLGGVIGGLPMFVISFLALGFGILLLAAEGILESYVTPVRDGIVSAISSVITSITIGGFIGLFIGISSSIARGTGFFSRILLRIVLGVLGLLLITYFVYEELLSLGETSLLFLLISMYGLICGVCFNRIRVSWTRCTIILLIFYVFVITISYLIKSFYNITYFLSIFSFVLFLLEWISICFILGYVFLNPLPTSSNTRSWKKFFLWLGVGLALEFILPFLSSLTLNRLIDPTVFAAIGILIGSGNEEGRKLMNWPQLQFDLRTGTFLYDKRISRERFFRCFFIAFTYLLLLLGMFYFNLFFYNHGIYTDQIGLYKKYFGRDYLVYFVTLIVFAITIFSILFGLFIGVAYGYGYVLFSKLESMNKNKWIAIGTFMIAFGIIVGALPSLII